MTNQKTTTRDALLADASGILAGEAANARRPADAAFFTGKLWQAVQRYSDEQLRTFTANHALVGQNGTTAQGHAVQVVGLEIQDPGQLNVLPLPLGIGFGPYAVKIYSVPAQEFSPDK